MITTVNLHGIQSIVIDKAHDSVVTGRSWQEIHFIDAKGSEVTAVVFFAEGVTPLPVTAQPVEAQHETV
jgi:hypothetical protein